MKRAPMDERLRPFTPDAKNPFDFAAAAHLVRRTECGAPFARIDALRRMGPKAALREILSAPASKRHARTLAMGSRVARRGEIRPLQAWWLRRFLVADRPFREHLALFWHDHFATSYRKVNDLVPMHDQNLVFLERGSGVFAKLLDAIARDPAMLVWLDNTTSTRAHPNENFARELFELFTLGLGQYEERDIKEAARAFTGWQVRGGRFHFNAGEHDPGTKRIFGKKSPMGGEDVMRLACERRACHRFIATKLARWFVSEEIPEDLAAALGRLYDEVGRDTGAYLERLLGSRWFFSPEVRGALVRSPVQLVVGALRSVEARVNTMRLAVTTENLGQSLFQPPSVEGWRGGLHWIDSASMIGRQNFGIECAEGESGALKCRVSKTLDGVEERHALWRALAGTPPTETAARRIAELGAERGRDPRHLLALWLQTPEAQLS